MPKKPQLSLLASVLGLTLVSDLLLYGSTSRRTDPPNTRDVEEGSRPTIFCELLAWLTVWVAAGTARPQAAEPRDTLALRIAGRGARLLRPEETWKAR